MSDLPRLRLAVVGVVVLSLFFALFARLWYLQVLDHAEFAQVAARNQVRILYTEAPRGRILDRNGKELVSNRVSQAVTVKRRDVTPEAVDRLAALLDLPRAELQQRIDDPNVSPYKPVPVAEDVAEEIVVHLRERAREFPGVEAAQLARRDYKFPGIAAHVLGYVGEVNDRELEARKRDGYKLGDTIGKAGVEQVYERDLRGQPGVVKLEVDSEGRVLRTLDARPPARGNDVQLTLDVDVQRVAEESLAKGLEAAKGRRDRENREPFKAPAGSTVVLDPRDGSVLAMASFPTYDPAEFVNGISPERFRQLQDPGGYYPLNNRAIVGQYAPGSTFKLLTAIAGLEKGLVTDRTVIKDGGTFTLSPCRGKCTFRNAGGRAYGNVALARSLTVSSDVYYYQLGARLWRERAQHGDAIQEVARQYGLGTRTGIPLPGEAKGRILDPEGKKKLHESAPKVFAEPRWFTGDSVNLAIGQGETVVTPLQLANVYATFANGGTVYKPRVAARVLDPTGKEIRSITVEAHRQVPVPPARAAIDAGLRGVLTSGEGTAAGAFSGFPLNTFPIAGKTGTAQVSRKQDSAVFAAYGPATAPEYAVSVVMEEAGFGGSTAAPVARRIFDQLAGQPPGEINLGSGID